MVNQQKSKCQLRLEARTLAYQQKQRQHPTASSSSSESDSDSASISAKPYAVRVQRAAETRSLAQRQRRAHARARVQHAQRVAAETWAKRREAVSKSRVAAREKLEVASARREDALQRLQDGCKRRLEAVLEKVESVKEVQRYREERQRRALEDQLVDAARRRDEQTQKMVQRLSQRWQCVESVKDRVQRAKFIQRWFRRHVDARKAAKKLQTVKSHVDVLVTSWQRVATSSFDDSMVVMQQRELARAAQYVLRVLLPSANGDLSPSKDASPSPRANKSAPFRVLLMVGMLAAHPAEIMENNQCDRLAFASKAVLREMDRIFVCLRDSDADAQSAIHARALKNCVAQLEARFAFYFECFSLWKDRDAQRLATEMLRSYHDIYRTKLHYTAKAAKEVDHVNDGLLQLLRQTDKQLMQLRSAIAQVIGRDDAVQRIDAVEQASAESANANRGNNSEDEMEVERSAEPSPAKPRTRASPPTRAHGVNVAIASPSPPSDLAQPPAQVESLLGDEKLVHELILNPSFRLPSMANANAAESLAGRVRGNMVKAFWDQAVASNDVNTLLLHLDELRGLFGSVVKSRSDLVAEVANALEPSVLRVLLASPSDHFDEMRARCVRVVQAIRLAEAPARTDTTDAFLSTFTQWCNAIVAHASTAPSAIHILVDFVAFAMDKVEQIRADMINAHLGMLATYLSRHGAQYEQKKLHAKLATGATFPLTKKWLQLELTTQLPTLSAETKQRLYAGHATAFAQVIRTSMMALVTKFIDGSAGVWPETFALDVDRIRGFRDALDRTTLISTMLVVLQEYIARRRLPTSHAFFAKMAKDLNVLLGSPGISGANLVTRAMDELQQFQAAATHGADIREDPEFQALEMRLQTSFQAGNPIFTLFSSRVASAVQSVVLRGDWEMHPSLAPFETELRELALAMRKLFQHNEGVHATLYNAEIKKILQQSVAQ